MSCQIMSALVLLVALTTSAVGQQEIQPIARERPEGDAASTAPKLVLETGGFTTAITASNSARTVSGWPPPERTRRSGSGTWEPAGC